MKKNIKILSIVIVVIGLVGYGIYSFLQPLAVETKTIAMRQSEISFIESGIVTNSGEQVIYPLTGGIIEEIWVREGDTVKKGDVLAVLDASILEYEMQQMKRNIEGYEAQLASAELEYQLNQDTLLSNKNNLKGQLQALNAEANAEGQRELEELIAKQSQKTYERGLEDLAKYKELFEGGYISESDYKDFEALVDSYKVAYDQSSMATKSNMDYYEGMRKSINAQISNIDVTLATDTLSSTKAYYESLIDGGKASLEALSVQLSNYNIVSTIDGIVDQVLIRNVNRIDGIEPAFIIQGEGASQIEVKVNTRDINAIAEGDHVRLILDRRSGDIELSGEIVHIAENATVEMSPLGIEVRKVLVLIKPDSRENLNSGYDLDVEFIVYSDGNKLILPNSALFKKDGADMVLVIRDGKVVEAPITLGYELTGETIVEQGIEEGDQVITDIDAKGLAVGIRVTSSNE